MSDGECRGSKEEEEEEEKEKEKGERGSVWESELSVNCMQGAVSLGLHELDQSR